MSEFVVLKWPMTQPEQEFFMQPGPVIAVAWQKGNPTLWVQHDIGARKVTRRFVAVATGSSYTGGRHVGSAVSDELVYHVYELSR